MKKMLLLISLCLVPTLSNAMNAFNLIAKNKDATDAFVKVCETSEQQRIEKKEKETYKKELAKKNIFEREFTKAVDKGHEKAAALLKQTNSLADARLKQLDNASKKRIKEVKEIVGPVAQATIKSAAGDAFKGVFCSILAILGGAILYKTLCNDDKDTDNDPEKQKKHNIKLLAGTALLLVGGGLGFYVFG